MTRLVAGAATDIGLVRAVNQDHLLVEEPLFAVADGMGGHAAGEVASETAVIALKDAIAQVRLSGPLTEGTVAEAVRRANLAVWEQAQSNIDFRGMGTTLTAVIAVGDGFERLAVANVGDSRTYRLRDGRLEQLTADHSLVAELVAEGQIRPDEAETHPQRHVLTRALGVYPDVEVDVRTAEVREGDRLLLCSDGLSREVSDEQIASLLRRFADPAEAARELVAVANDHGGNDNITVVVIDAVPDSSPSQAASAVAMPAGTPGGESDVAIRPTTAGVLTDDTQALDLTAIRAAATGDAPEAVASEEPASASAPAPPSTRRRRQPRPAAPRHRIVTPRVLLFFLALIALVAIAYGGTAWYARSAYFVGVRSGHLAIYQGRPGGVLWWNPTVAEVTPVTTSEVEAVYLPALRNGVEESSLAAARAYVDNLRRRARNAGIGTTSGTTPSGAAAPGTAGRAAA